MDDGARMAGRIEHILAHTGIDRAFLVEAPMRWETIGGATGIALQVRLTSYRALPLSCIAGIELSLDGAALDMREARLGVGGVFHPLSMLAEYTAVFWFVLDFATLFVPLAAHPGPGLHRLVGRLATVEPYITAGRFVFYNSSTRDSPMEGAAA